MALVSKLPHTVTLLCSQCNELISVHTFPFKLLISLDPPTRPTKNKTQGYTFLTQLDVT